MLIDVRTLVVVLSMTLGLATLFLVILGRLHAGLKGARYWAAGMALIAIATALIFMRDMVPPFLSIGIANGVLIGGMTILAIGFLEFTGRRAPVRGLAVFVALSWLPFLILYETPEALAFRIIVSNTALCVVALVIAWALYGNAPARAAARRLTGLIFALYALALLVRSIGVVLNPPDPTSFMQAHPATALFYLLSIGLIFAVTVGMTVMVSERLRDELQARIQDLDRARRKAETALGEQRNFMAMVSHEFRTPLGIMNASAEVIACNLAPDDLESAEEVARIRRASVRLANLVEGCLADEWLETASESRRSGSVDLGAVLAGLAGEHDVEFTQEGAGSVILDADPYLLPIAFSCLIDNARKYGRTHAGARIRLCAELDSVMVEICDDGPGIDPHEAPRVFEKFYRSPQVLRKPGAGLGLYLVRRIITLHGGRVDLDQTRGTIFRVVLPVNGRAEA